jgi:antitoxin (DNA-binding transcriptional repressor) of toxin-antitoxin stability system
MTDTVNLYDAKTNLSELVDRAAAGEEIVIANQASRKPSWFRISPPEKAPVRAELARHHVYCR